MIDIRQGFLKIVGKELTAYFHIFIRGVMVHFGNTDEQRVPGVVSRQTGRMPITC
jgi:hypothetical protein